MDTLWASLIGLFVIAIAVVLAFNLLQGRQVRLRDAWREKLAAAGRPAPGPRPSARGEPTVGPGAGPAGAPPVAERVEPTFGPAAGAREPPGAAGGPGRAARDAVDAQGEAGAERAATERASPPIAPAAGPGRAGGAGRAAAPAMPDERDPGPARRDAAPEAPPALRGGMPAVRGATPAFREAEQAASATGASDAPGTRAAAGPADVDPGPVPGGAAGDAAAPDPAAGPILDPRLDCIVTFGLGAPVAPERLLSVASTLRRAGSKPIAVEVDGGDGRWAVPQASFGAVRRARAGVLLANRHGPLNAMEFSEFTTAMQALGRAIGAGGAIVPAMQPVLEHARQLDDACARLDAVIGLNVETPTALSPGELAALATGLGLQERGNTRFAALGEDGEVLYSLALGERAEQLTLLLDVPRAPQHAEPWPRMVEAAHACAERTGGRVVDDANRPLTDAAAAEVERQLEQRYRTLAEAGLDAGSPAALRVFN